MGQPIRSMVIIGATSGIGREVASGLGEVWACVLLLNC